VYAALYADDEIWAIFKIAADTAILVIYLALSVPDRVGINSDNCPASGVNEMLYH
jgi:hypothetical protein